jgi:hypothetical protein
VVTDPLYLKQSFSNFLGKGRFRSWRCHSTSNKQDSRNFENYQKNKLPGGSSYLLARCALDTEVRCVVDLLSDLPSAKRLEKQHVGSASQADGVPACPKADTHNLALGDCFGSLPATEYTTWRVTAFGQKQSLETLSQGPFCGDLCRRTASEKNRLVNPLLMGPHRAYSSLGQR